MGNSQSSGGHEKRTQSTPVFASGRVSIYESPKGSTGPLATLRRLRKQQNAAAAAGADNDAPPFLRRSSSGTGLEKQQATETTPLKQQPKPFIDRELSSSAIGSLPSPPLAKWIGPALSCALCYALYNIFIKKGSASIHPVLGGVILQFVAAFLGIGLLTIITIRNHLEEVAAEAAADDDATSASYALFYDRNGVFWSIWAGLAVGLAEMISFFVSGMGVQAMQSIPIIIGGSVMFGTVLGWAVLGEMLTIQGWIGVAMLVCGIGLVGTDPGAAEALGG